MAAPAMAPACARPQRAHQRMDARSALHEVLEEYTALFSKIPDEYLKERMADLRDVIGRIATHLNSDGTAAGFDPGEPVIVAKT